MNIKKSPACMAAEEYERQNPNRERNGTELYNAFMAGVAWQRRAALKSQDAEDAFIDGVLLGLQVITGAGNAGSADHDELMRSAGVDLVVRRAIEQEMWELAGLDRNQISITARRRIEGET